MQPAQEIARAYLEGRDPRCRYGDKVFVVPLQSNDGYRLAYCFGFTDLEVHAYIAHMIRGDVRRLPPELRPFYAGFLTPGTGGNVNIPLPNDPVLNGAGPFNFQGLIVVTGGVTMTNGTEWQLADSDG